MSAENPRQPLRILLVDDNTMCRAVTLCMLEDCGYEVVEAVDGRAAVEAVDRGSYSLVLMDIEMPEMDGFEALALIRGRERRGDVRLPVVAMTGLALGEDREFFLAAGFDDCLPKPTEMESLRRTIELHARTAARDARTTGRRR